MKQNAEMVAICELKEKKKPLDSLNPALQTSTHSRCFGSDGSEAELKLSVPLNTLFFWSTKYFCRTPFLNSCL